MISIIRSLPAKEGEEPALVERGLIDFPEVVGAGARSRMAAIAAFGVSVDESHRRCFKINFPILTVGSQ
jgi:hypothetical protein